MRVVCLGPGRGFLYKRPLYRSRWRVPLGTTCINYHGFKFILFMITYNKYKIRTEAHEVQHTGVSLIVENEHGWVKTRI